MEKSVRIDSRRRIEFVIFDSAQSAIIYTDCRWILILHRVCVSSLAGLFIFSFVSIFTASVLRLHFSGSVQTWRKLLYQTDSVVTGNHYQITALHFQPIWAQSQFKHLTAANLIESYQIEPPARHIHNDDRFWHWIELNGIVFIVFGESPITGNRRSARWIDKRPRRLRLPPVASQSLAGRAGDDPPRDASGESTQSPDGRRSMHQWLAAAAAAAAAAARLLVTPPSAPLRPLHFNHRNVY